MVTIDISFFPNAYVLFKFKTLINYKSFFCKNILNFEGWDLIVFLGHWSSVPVTLRTFKQSNRLTRYFVGRMTIGYKVITR